MIAEFDPCSSNPCKNGATCSAKAGRSKTTFECFCAIGYGGELCESSKLQILFEANCYFLIFRWDINQKNSNSGCQKRRGVYLNLLGTLFCSIL